MGFAALHCIPKFVKNQMFTENILTSNSGWQKEKYFIEVWLELSLQHRNEDLAKLKHIISVGNSEINTLKDVVCSTQRRCFILQHNIYEEKKPGRKWRRGIKI
jgi:hypothetical protein